MTHREKPVTKFACFRIQLVPLRDGTPGDAELDELDAAEEEVSTLKRTLKRALKQSERNRRDALAAKEIAEIAAAERDAETAAASKNKQTAITAQKVGPLCTSCPIAWKVAWFPTLEPPKI